MTGQMSIYDFGTDPPEVWDCMKTCKHANEYTDTFPASNKKRCRYGAFQPGIGTTGNDWYEKVVDDLCHFYCKFYEMEDKT